MAQPPISSSLAGLNRYVEVGVGVTHQDYREQDTQRLTADGFLDTESGKQKNVSLTLAWQGDSGWFTSLSGERVSGNTEYSGYLQNTNRDLSGYSAITSNVVVHTSVRVGYALNEITMPPIPSQWQLIPIVQIGRHRWNRGLAQYAEDYSFDTRELGALVQWKVTAGTVFEAQALVGKTSYAEMIVPSLGFAATQVGGNSRQWQIAITQDIGAATNCDELTGWRLFARYLSRQRSHGASPIMDGLQAPPNENKTDTVMVGLQRQL